VPCLPHHCAGRFDLYRYGGARAKAAHDLGRGGPSPPAAAGWHHTGGALRVSVSLAARSRTPHTQTNWSTNPTYPPSRVGNGNNDLI